MNTKLVWRLLASIGVIGLTAFGVAAFAHGPDTSLIHACVDKKTGEVRIVQTPEFAVPGGCSDKEIPYDWNPVDQAALSFPNGGRIIWEDQFQRFFFEVPSPDSPTGYRTVFGIQDALLDMNAATYPEDKKMFFFHWEGGEEGQYAGLVYHPSTATLAFNLSPTPNAFPIEAVTINGSVLDASAVDIKGKIIRQPQKPGPDQLLEGAFAFWLDTSSLDGDVYLIVKIGGVVRATPMQ